MQHPAQTTVALIQLSHSGDDRENLDRSLAAIETAARSGAQVVCLQELFRSPYFCQQHDPKFFDLAEPIPGPTTQALATLARDHKLVIIAPIFEKRAPGLYHNSLAVLNIDGSVMGTYRKMHIPHDPQFYEKYYFAPGDLGYKIFDTPYGKLGVLICWDQWFPEAARATALMGAEILFYPTAIGYIPADKAEFGVAQRDAWTTMQRAHAISNGVFVAACNRVGVEKTDCGELEFWGSSFVCDPFGRILAVASEAREENLIVPCDFRLIEQTRRNWPFLRDRRIDSYDVLARKYSS